MLIQNSGRIVERNGNPKAAAAAPLPATSAGSPGYLKNSLGLPLTLGGGNTARVSPSSSNEQQKITVSGPNGNAVLNANAQVASVQIDPEGKLAFSDGRSVTRWDPTTGQSQSFGYSFPDQYGTERFDGMLALTGGRTLVVGTAGHINPHLLSIHDSDGSLKLAVDMARTGGTSIDDVFASKDRNRIYLSCHEQGGPEGRLGHAVYRLDLKAEKPALRKLCFHETNMLYADKAVVTDREEILLFQRNKVKRLGPEGGDHGSYTSLGALRRDLGGLAKPAEHMAYQHRPSKAGLNDFFKELGDLDRCEVPIEDGFFRYSAQRDEFLQAKIAELGLTEVPAFEHPAARVLQESEALLVDFPLSGMVATYADQKLTLFDADGSPLRVSEERPLYEKGKLLFAEASYDLVEGTVEAGDWLKVVRGQVEKAQVGGPEQQVAYLGDGRFRTDPNNLKQLPLEPEALGFPLALAPVAGEGKAFERKQVHFSDSPAFDKVLVTEKVRSEAVDPFHWVAAPKETVLDTDVVAYLAGGTVVSGDKNSVRVNDKALEGSLKLEPNILLPVPPGAVKR